MREARFDRERIPAGQEARDPNGNYERANPAKDYQLALQAGVPIQYQVPRSRSFTLISASGGTPVTVRFNGGSQKQTMNPGDGQDAIDFDDIEVESAAAQTIKFRIGDGYQRTGISVNNTVTATVQNANTSKGVPDVAVGAGLTVLVVGANATRKEVLIKSRSVNTDNVRLGNAATVGATTGLELEPGQTATFDTEAAVYAHNPGTTSVTLTVTELERV